MIIVSQTKDEIIILENCLDIRAMTSIEGRPIVISHFPNGLKTLGEYETKERANDVLIQIVNAAGLHMYMYQMPAK